MSSNKTAVITGSNAGIGFETALALAKMNYKVLLLCRNEQKASEAVEALKQKSGNADIGHVVADLSSKEDIAAAAKNISLQFDHLDALVNNAGIWLSERTLNKDGIEVQFAVNHLAPFLLTHLLLPLLLKSDDARIVNVNSDTHFRGKIDFNDLTLSKGYNGIKSYAHSKLSNCLFTYELDRKLKQKGIQNMAVNALQPGLVKTDIGFKHTFSLHALVWKIRREFGVTPEEGAKTSVYLATAPELKGISGLYWDKCASKPSSKNSYIEADAQKMWAISKEMCGIADFFVV
ncbi:MAG: SDR family oxidoreductase [Chitinophagales bacterium]